MKIRNQTKSGIIALISLVLIILIPSIIIKNHIEGISLILMEILLNISLLSLITSVFYFIGIFSNERKDITYEQLKRIELFTTIGKVVAAILLCLMIISIITLHNNFSKFTNIIYNSLFTTFTIDIIEVLLVGFMIEKNKDKKRHEFLAKTNLYPKRINYSKLFGELFIDSFIVSIVLIIISNKGLFPNSQETYYCIILASFIMMGVGAIGKVIFMIIDEIRWYVFKIMIWYNK